LSRKREHEKALFAAFLEAAPEFCGERLAEWHQTEDERDFPDIEGVSVTGRKIGVEIGEWLNEEEIQAAKRKERVEAGILDVIGDQGKNPTRHIEFVWLHPKSNARISSGDRTGFRDQLCACILESDRRWPHERFWKTGHQLSGDDLSVYPVLAKYLDAIKLWPGDEAQWEQNWITFPMRAGAFDADTMRRPLRQLVAEKIWHYGTTNTGFDDLSLLVIYNRAAIYNSPVETPLHSYEDAVAELKRVIGNNRGAFNRVFLYIAVRPGEQVFHVC